MKWPLRVLGYAWSIVHNLVGLAFFLSVYWPKKVRWEHGAIHVVVKRRLIPEGMDQTGDGDLDDPEDFVTGAQTHGLFIFYRDDNVWDWKRLKAHELTHVFQGMIFGPFYPILYGIFSGVLFLWPGKDFYRDNPFERWANWQEARGIPWLLK